MNYQKKTLRISIEGRWTVEDMVNPFLAVRDLYNLRFFLQVIREDMSKLEHFWSEMHDLPPLRHWPEHARHYPFLFPMPYAAFPHVPLESEQLGKVAQFLYPEEELLVARIKYGSPGFKDITGIGEIVVHVKDFLVKLIETYCMREQRQLENEERRLRDEQIRIENARKFVQLAKECGYSEVDLRRLTNWVDEKQEVIIVLVEQGKVKSADLLKGEPDRKEG